LQNARRYDEAIQQFQNAIKMQPDKGEAYEFLGYAYDAKGMYAEAITAYQKRISLEGENLNMQGYLGYALAMSGKRNEAVVILDKLKTTKDYVSPAELAILYAGLGDKEEAFTELERAYAARDTQMQYLKVEPHYDSLRSDPRFVDLIRRMGLPR
jgi:tetratricopeptide (TPR) repeat protein